VARKVDYVQCNEWREKTIRRIIQDKARRKIVVIAFNNHYAGWIRDKDEMIIRERKKVHLMLMEGLKELVKQFAAAGIKVVVLRDTPRMYQSFAECLVNGGGRICDRPRKTALVIPPLEEAAIAQMLNKGDVVYLDLSDNICDERSCSPLRDGKVIYRDFHHITKRFSRSLAPEFSSILTTGH